VPIRVRPALLICLVVLAAGCGSERGDETFAGEGYSFTYPGEWDELKSEMGVQRGDPVSQATVGPGTHSDGLVVLVYRIPVSINEQNFMQFTDAAAQDVAESFDGQILAGPTRLRVAGLPAFRLDVSSTNNGQALQSNMVFFFDGKTEYFLNCQLTQERADEMKRGCEQAVNSFKVG
jgi:PsbP-like protein